jgi:hypothetical protein
MWKIDGKVSAIYNLQEFCAEGRFNAPGRDAAGSQTTGKGIFHNPVCVRQRRDSAEIDGSSYRNGISGYGVVCTPLLRTVNQRTSGTRFGVVETRDRMVF